MLEILYTLTIWPLEILFEFIFALAKFVLKGNIVLSILSLSLAVNILTLPLYRKADKLQEDNKEKQSKMEPMIAHIKKTFKGDERFMMLQTYYRENDYKPIYALKGSISLFLQIPFFIAAYHFLSNIPGLRGASFGPVKNLGIPDAIFMIGSFSINVLPILMTIINIVSGAIYTKGQPVKTKIQLYGIAGVFLVLLYNSPAGLVLYWTYNNLFSLVKNIFDKLLNNKKTVKRKESKKKNTVHEKDFTFWMGTIFLAVFTGLYIPTSIIKSSPAEFTNIWNLSNPSKYILFAELLAFGTFVLWVGIYYLLSGLRIKKFMTKIIFILCIIAVFNYSFLGKWLGLLNSNMKYDEDSIFLNGKIKILNLAINVFLAVLIYLIIPKIKKMMKSLLVVGVLTSLVFIVTGIVKINTEYKEIIEIGKFASTDDFCIPLSKNGQNVMIIMLDRAMGTQFPYIINEKPELLEAFDGFTYYPNTVSYGRSTITGSAALFGGYEYTPEEMNKRDTEFLVDKQDEALCVLPVLFSQNDYKVTVCDPPLAGYGWIPDLSIYDEYDGISSYITERRFNGNSEENYEQTEYLRKRNFFCNAIMRISPLIIWGKIYDEGDYNTSDSVYIQINDGLSKAQGINENFMNWYSFLDNLSDVSVITNDGTNTFFMMANGATHEPCLLQEPNYVPQMSVDNSEYDIDWIEKYTVNGITMKMDNQYNIMSYDSNIASIIKLGEWFMWMKVNGVYDNTRIVIVADHGCALDQFDYKAEDGTDMEAFMPLLLMKDFNAKGFSVSDEFMTHADGVPFLVNSIIINPINPFTGNMLDGHEKSEDGVIVFYSEDFSIDSNIDRKTFDVGRWYKIKNDVYNMDNWEYMGEY